MKETTVKQSLSDDEQMFLEEAVRFLENPRFLVRVANTIGKPVEALQRKLPEKMKLQFEKAVSASLNKCIEIAVYSIPKTDSATTHMSALNKRRLHVLLASGIGAVGGFFGLASLPVELPLTTTVMLRSIAEIAKNNGEDLQNPEVLLECIQVFAMGSTQSEKDDAINSSYLESRLVFSGIVKKAAQYIAQHSSKEVLSAIEKKTAPELIIFISRVASQFNIVVSEKMLAEVVPIIGAIGSASINGFFTDHFNTTANFHFGIKKLERKYGLEVIQNQYMIIKNK